MVTPIREYEIGQFYHVYNRGNRKQTIFYQLRDRLRFLEHYQKYCEDHHVTTLSYCLMDNHFHFLVILEEPDALTKLFGKLSTSHAKFINKKYELTGSLFESRFQAKRILEEPHLLHSSRYIHRNPIDLPSVTRGVEAEMVLDQLAAYRWSSLGEVFGLRPASFVNVNQLLEVTGTKNVEAYRQFMLDEIRYYLYRDEISGKTRGVEAGRSK